MTFSFITSTVSALRVYPGMREKGGWTGARDEWPNMMEMDRCGGLKSKDEEWKSLAVQRCQDDLTCQ